MAHPRFRIQPDSFGHRLSCREMSRGSDCSSRPATAGCRERRSTGRKIEARFGLLLGPGPPNFASIGRSVFKTVGRFESRIVS